LEPISNPPVPPIAVPPYPYKRKVVTAVMLVNPEMVMVFEVAMPATGATTPRFAANPSAEERRATLIGPEPDLSQLKTNEVGVKEKFTLGVTINWI
jgi:hypothetical protein